MCGSETTRARAIHLAEVMRNDRLCDEHFIMQLGLEEFGPCAAGHFVQLQCREPGERTSGDVHDQADWREQEFGQPELARAEPLLRRPFSLANVERSEDGVVLDIIYRTVGIGTSWLATVEKGSRLSVLGPLGNPFPIFEDRPCAALVGGGVGIPPMMYLARSLAEVGKDAVAFSGFRTADLCFLGPDNEFDFPCEVASDDGTIGYRGFVTGAFDEWRRGADPTGLVVYGCGPEPMMQALGEICIKNGIDCFLSMERRMACGMGTCQSCVVKIADDSDQGWGFRLCCTDGPVFAAEKIIWT